MVLQLRLTVMKLHIALYLHLKRQPHKPSTVPPKFLCYEALLTGALGNLKRPCQLAVEAGKLIFRLPELLARWLASEKLCSMYTGKDWDNLTSFPYRTDLLIIEFLSHRDSLFYTLLGNTHSTAHYMCNDASACTQNSTNILAWLAILHSNSLFSLVRG